ncbi:MFS transporter [Haliangium sp.]|uniref:MFS transporter n=1 Tax=Haliangium sp. TaxID=2663208 RepID=UPI003D0E3572
MARDLRLFYLFRLLATSYLWVPIFVAFMRQRGLGFDEIALLHALYSVVVILVEIPTGALADRIGRRQSMMVGALAMVASCLVAYNAHGLAAFALAEILAAMSMALCSGADSAYLYDLLKRHQRGDEYPRREGAASAWHLAGSGLAFAAGGALGSIDLALPYLVTAGVSALAFVIALFMSSDRPAPGHTQSAAAELGSYIRHMHGSLRDVITSRRLTWIIGYAAVVFVLLRSTVVLYQPYLDSRGFSTTEIGLVYAGSAFVAAFAARRFSTICRWASEDGLAYWLLGALSASFLLLNHFHGAWAPLSMLLVQAVANGLYSPLAKTMLNRNIVDSSRRATILSVESIARRAAMGVFWPIAGVVGSSAAMYLCGGIGFAGFIVLAVLGAKLVGPMASVASKLPGAMPVESREDRA